MIYDALSKFANYLLTVFHQNLIAVTLLTILTLLVYVAFDKYGFKKVAKEVVCRIRKDKQFRWIVIFFFYFFWVISMTLLTRTLIESPYNRVLEGWTLEKYKDGNWDFDAASNLVLFIPMIFLLFKAFPHINREQRLKNVLLNAIRASFCLSCIIECWQLFLAIGTFQLADIVYNTLSGLIGGVIYWCGYKLTHREKKVTNETITCEEQ